jgi:esterase/lipase superfamily enzyme
MHWLSDRLIQGFTLAALCLFPGTCSSNDEGQQRTGRDAVAVVSAPPDDVIRRTVPFITLRNKTDSTLVTEYFGGERGEIHTGYCEVSWTPIPMLEPLANNMPFYVPQGTIRLEAIQELGEGKFWRERQAAGGKERPLLYIHGYNIGFAKGCSRAAIFQEKLGLAGRLLLLSWPSNDAVLNYTHDESDIYWSVAEIERTIEHMLSSFGAGNFDLVAHSMGARGAFLALVLMSAWHRSELPLVNRLVLLAPDIDAGLFSQYLDAIRPLARNITIYVSGNDSALILSEEVHGYPRLGMSGAHLRDLGGVEIVDVSATGRRRASGHLYHLYNQIVINDLGQLLNADKPASDRTGLQQDLRMGLDYWRLAAPPAN